MLKPYAAKCLQYMKKHRLAMVISIALTLYEVARLCHFEMGHPSELFAESLIEVILSRFVGGD